MTLSDAPIGKRVKLAGIHGDRELVRKLLALMDACHASRNPETPVAKASRHVTIALIGNPNCGKTALFNALTGIRQRTGNWPGVTVERKVGSCVIDDRP